MTQNFEFAFVVEGLELDNLDALDSLYTTFDDVGAADQLGRTTIEFVVEAVSAGNALKDTLFRFRSGFPDVSVVRLDRDLVNVSEIADRLGRTPECVRLLVNGTRGSGRFPSAVGVLPGGTRIWEWSTVYRWLEQCGYEVDSNQPIDFWIATEFDYYLLQCNSQFRQGEIRVIKPISISSTRSSYHTQFEASPRELSEPKYALTRS